MIEGVSMATPGHRRGGLRTPGRRKGRGPCRFYIFVEKRKKRQGSHQTLNPFTVLGSGKMQSDESNLKIFFSALYAD
jgi:hypothetical protein